LIAKEERDKYNSRVKAMEEWLVAKKLEEAERVAHLRDIDQREEIYACMRD